MNSVDAHEIMDDTIVSSHKGEHVARISNVRLMMDTID